MDRRRALADRRECSLQAIGVARYTLRLAIAPRAAAAITFTWTIVVPEQRLPAHVECHPSRARRGDKVTATLHNEGSAALFTGAAFGLERHDGERWDTIDPFDGKVHAWPAIGLVVGPGGTLDDRFTSPTEHPQDPTAKSNERPPRRPGSPTPR
jgi:hypothetical protein